MSCPYCGSEEALTVGRILEPHLLLCASCRKWLDWDDPVPFGADPVWQWTDPGFARTRHGPIEIGPAFHAPGFFE